MAIPQGYWPTLRKVTNDNFLPLSELAPTPDEVKPTWRGWIHTGVLPFVVLGGVILLIVAEGWMAKTSVAIYFASSVLLFGNSALYHRINWRPLVKRILKRIDHANIFLLIAGTYTPMAFSALTADKGSMLLITVWIVALLGIFFRVFWISAPRWLYVPIYLGMGWLAIFYVVDLWQANWVMMLLIAIGGLCYTMGAIFYGAKWPKKNARHFGFHEYFHALTVAAFFCHWTGALLISINPVAGSISAA
jgi:hemolysin III